MILPAPVHRLLICREAQYCHSSVASASPIRLNATERSLYPKQPCSLYIKG
ncbi:hypothetical protein NDA01_01895 [Trichocoleus desertorum AS-A10]|uniref:hypothetical protein n=1 Tax=Trichocoleus desertorum TaxID=1481672 RepID=UPI003299F2FD